MNGLTTDHVISTHLKSMHKWWTGNHIINKAISNRYYIGKPVTQSTLFIAKMYLSNYRHHSVFLESSMCQKLFERQV